MQKHYLCWPIEIIAQKLRRSVGQVKRQAWKLRLFKQSFWTNSEEKRLKQLYSRHTLEETAQKLGRGIQSVQAKIKHMGLSKRKKTA